VTNCTGHLQQARSFYVSYRDWRQQNAVAAVRPQLQAFLSAAPQTGFPSYLPWTALNPDPRHWLAMRIQREADDWRTGRESAKVVLELLERAKVEDPTDAYAAAELAHWHGQLWEYFSHEDQFIDKALETARQAQKLDPNGREGYLAEYRLHWLAAERARAEADLRMRQAEQTSKKEDAEKLKQRRKNRFDYALRQYGRAADMLNEVLKREPKDGRLRAQLDEVYSLQRQVEGQLGTKQTLEGNK
jgi:hypothetical protein